MKKHAIVIGASNESIHAIELAKKRGLKVLAFDGNPNAPGFNVADEYYALDINNVDSIYKIIDDHGIYREDMFVLPVPIGRALVCTGLVNEHYGLIGPNKELTEICTDKWLFHHRLNKCGLRNNECVLVKKGEVCNLTPKAPLIVKPRFGSGSREVMYIASEKEWNSVVKRMPFEEDFVVEDAIPGQEYGVDGMVLNGEFYSILIRKKINTPYPIRQCIGYMNLRNDNQSIEIEKCINEYLKLVIGEIGMENGVFHADVILNGDKPFVIELSPRPSGHRLHDLFTPLVTGIDMVSVYIDYVNGEVYPINKSVLDSVYLIRFFDMESEIKRIPNQEYIVNKYNVLKYNCNLKVGDKRHIIDGHSLINRGFFILRGNDEDEVCIRANELLAEFT